MINVGGHTMGDARRAMSVERSAMSDEL